MVFFKAKALAGACDLPTRGGFGPAPRGPCGWHPGGDSCQVPPPWVCRARGACPSGLGTLWGDATPDTLRCRWDTLGWVPGCIPDPTVPIPTMQPESPGVTPQLLVSVLAALVTLTGVNQNPHPQLLSPHPGDKAWVAGCPQGTLVFPPLPASRDSISLPTETNFFQIWIHP